jgi:hypothetical protein
MDLVNQISTLERALRDHIARWERFFAGDLRVPPVDERERIARRLRWLGEQSTTRHEDRFRITNLQHRFQSHSQNWERMLREREEGRGRFSAPEPQEPPPPVPAPTPPDATPPAAVHGDEPSDLFARYAAAKRSIGQEVAIDRTAFDGQIEKQREALAERLGGDVRFDVVVEDGKVKLAARRRGPATEESP